MCQLLAVLPVIYLCSSSVVHQLAQQQGNFPHKVQSSTIVPTTEHLSTSTFLHCPLVIVVIASSTILHFLRVVFVIFSSSIVHFLLVIVVTFILRRQFRFPSNSLHCSFSSTSPLS
ncbi:hypothetical protein F4778DRAFT_682487 [Xylariomycetidae sp. FL2044]|nr:hypothetical protein F4778DRAFT_682487 [Xylariomycetidae sp. FL2044]